LREPFIILLIEKPSRFGQGLSELGSFHFSNPVKNDALLNGEKSLRTNEAWPSQMPLLEIASVQRRGEIIRPSARCDPTQNQIVAGKIDKCQSRSAFSRGQIGLREGNDDNFAGYRFAHAASSSGEFQSRARTDPLSSAPLNDSSPAFLFRRIAKS
jgi:hypothetical protein